MRPSCASTTLRTIARPSPDPCGLVVKNALKIRSAQLLRHPRAVVGDLDHDGARHAVRVARVRVVLQQALAGRDLDRALPVQRLEGVDDEVREELAELVVIALDRGQAGVHVDAHDRPAARHLALGQRDRVGDHVAQRRVLDLQPDRPHELERLVHDPVGHLRFVDDVGENGLRIGRAGDLPLEHAGHHLDARQRVLDLVRNRRRHLAEGHQTIAEPLALLELFDLRQVLEEERQARRSAALVAYVRQRVADHLAARAQPQLGAVGEVGHLECAMEHAHDVRVLREHLRVRPSDHAVLRAPAGRSGALRRSSPRWRRCRSPRARRCACSPPGGGRTHPCRPGERTRSVGAQAARGWTGASEIRITAAGAPAGTRS